MNFYEGSFQELKEYFKIDPKKKKKKKSMERVILIRILKSNLAIVFWV